ncbi:MAG: PEGA domain-containing protein [Fibrobacter sp.]|nr:PEGA domain-containing protein [Fibrobacter sp.]
MLKRFALMFLGVCAVLTSTMAAEEGMLTVTTDPDGVEIWLGDNYIGNSPVIGKKVPVGRYTVKLIDPVMRISQTEQVMITANATVVIEKKLKPKFGTLRINSVPEDAEVYMTMPLGKTPLVNEFINPGKYILEIRHPNKLYKSSSENVTVTEGAVQTVLDTLEMIQVDKPKPNHKKVIARLALGGLAAAGFTFAIIRERDKQMHLWDGNSGSEAGRARTQEVIGITVGALSIVGFEIIAFF